MDGRMLGYGLNRSLQPLHCVGMQFDFVHFWRDWFVFHGRALSFRIHIDGSWVTAKAANSVQILLQAAQ